LAPFEWAARRALLKVWPSDYYRHIAKKASLLRHLGSENP
jgi:hypothetical protein